MMDDGIDKPRVKEWSPQVIFWDRIAKTVILISLAVGGIFYVLPPEKLEPWGILATRQSEAVLAVICAVFLIAVVSFFIWLARKINAL